MPTPSDTHSLTSAHDGRSVSDPDQPNEHAAPEACSLIVFHDGSCALCQREIALVQRLTGDSNIAFVDVSGAGSSLVTSGLTGDQAMRRFHVRRADGQLYGGARAFVELWSQTPRLAWLSKLARWPLIIRALDVLYSGLLVIRPPLSRMVRRLDHLRERRF